jgi:glucose-6-phosphate isomerase
MKITVDYNNILKKVIGENGITVEELEDINKKSAEIHNRIINEKDNGTIGFFNLPYTDTSDIKEVVNNLKTTFKYCVVLGIGGSALGTTALFEALGDTFKKNLFVVDNIDPEYFNNLLNSLNFHETLFVVISKSGSTAETISQFLIIRDKLIKKYGNEGYSKRVVIITDPEKGPLREIADNENLKSFAIPSNVGGRFSVLSPVGLFPLNFAGIDIDSLLEGALFMVNSIQESDIFKNSAYLVGAINYLFLKKKKNILVLMPYSSKLSSIADWFRQLWAESLGKNGMGSTPVKAIGTTDQHSQLQLYMEGPKDKLINFIKVNTFNSVAEIPEQDIIEDYKYLTGKSLNKLINTEMESTSVALAQAGVPNYTIALETITPFILGELIMLYEIATVFAGYLMGVNPFNQPGVELSKQFTYGLMGRKGFGHKKEEFERFFKNITK